MDKKYRSIYEAAKVKREKEKSAKKPSDYDFGVDDAYIKSFYDDFKKYTGEVEKDYDGISYSSGEEGLYDRHFSSRDSLRKRASNIRAYLNANKSKIDSKTHSSLISSLNSVDNYFESVGKSFQKQKDFYDSFDSQDAYNAWVKQQEEDDALATLDLDELRGEMEHFQNRADSVGELKKQVSSVKSEVETLRLAAKKDSSYASKLKEKEQTLATLEQRLAEEQKQSSVIKDRLTEVTNRYNRAKAVQDRRKVQGILDGVSDPTSENYDKDYRAYVKKGEDIENPSFDDSMPKVQILGWKPFGDGEEVNNPVTFNRDNYGRIIQWTAGEAQAPDAYDPVVAKMNDEQIDNYNYLISKYGRETADIYLETVRGKVKGDEADKFFSKHLEDKWLAEILYSGVQGLDQFTTGLNTALGSDEYVDKRVSDPQMIGALAREDLEDNSFSVWYNFKTGEWEDKIFGSSVGQTAYDFGSTTANMAPSLIAGAAANYIAPGSGAYVTTALMGTSAGGNAYREALQRGYNDEQAKTYGVLVGASEAGLQYLLGGISKAGGKLSGNIIKKMVDGVDNAWLKFAFEYGGSLASEGLEEGLQEVLTPLFENIAFNADNDWSDIDWEQAAYSALLGAMSAGVLEGPSIIGNTIAYNSAVKAEGKQIVNNNGVDALLNLANEVAGVVDSGTGAAISKQLGKVNGKNGVNTKAVGKLSFAVNEARVQMNKADIVSALEKKGVSGKKAENYANILFAMNEEYFAGKKSSLELGTDSQWKKITGDPNAFKVMSEVVTDKDSPVNLRNKKYASARNGIRTNEDGSLNQEDVAEYAVRKAAELTGGGLATDVENAFDVSADGKTIVEGYDGEVSKIEFVDAENGGLKVKVNGETDADLTSVSFGDIGQSFVVSAISDMGVGAADANAILNMFKGKGEKAGKAFANGISLAFKYGRYAYSTNKLSKIAGITKEQAQTAYAIGKTSRTEGAKSAQKELDNIAASKSKSKSKSKDTAKGSVVFEGAIADKKGNLAIGEDSLTEIQKASVEGIRLMAELSGINFHIFQSTEDGENFTYVKKNGEKVGANGWYRVGTNDIWIDLNAGSEGQGVMIETAAHEISHFIKEFSPEKWNDIAEYVMEWYASHYNKKVNELLFNQIRKVEARPDSANKTKQQIEDEAFEELVSDSLSRMLVDGTVVEAMANLKQKNKGLWNTIKEAVTKLLAKWGVIFDQYKDRNPDAVEATYFKETSKEFKKLQQMFAEAFADASETYSKVGNIEHTGSEVLSDRDSSGNVLTKAQQEYFAESQVRDADGNLLVGYATFNAKFSDSPTGVDFTKHRNYYKLIEDFNTYDNITETPTQQGAVTMNFPSAENRLTAEQKSAYEKALRDTGIFTEADIKKYLEKADMTFEEIVRAEVGSRKAYHEATEPNFDSTVKEVEDYLLGAKDEKGNYKFRRDSIADTASYYIEEKNHGISLKPATGSYRYMRRDVLDGVKESSREECKTIDMLDIENLARYYKEVHSAFKKTMPSGQMVLIGKTPDLLVKYGASEGPLYLPQTAIKKNDVNGKHSLGEAVIYGLPEELNDPLAITGQTTKHVEKGDNGIVVWTNWKDHNENSIVVPIRIIEETVFGERANIAVTLFDVNDVEYAADILREGNIKYTKKNESIVQLLSQRRYMPKAMASNAFDNIIEEYDQFVKENEEKLSDRTNAQLDAEYMDAYFDYRDTILANYGEATSVSDSDIRYSERVTDKKTLDFLNEQIERGEYITVYRSFQVIDGGLYAPMNAVDRDEDGKNKRLGYRSEIGQWEMATESLSIAQRYMETHPDAPYAKFDLDGVDNKTGGVAYNPYLHASNLVLNDQFAAAYRRNLVTVECRVPLSEADGAYKAEYAKDGTGWANWKAGGVAGQLKKAKPDFERKLFLSRYMIPVRVLPDAEVASMYREYLDGTDISVPWNVVTPSLRNELEKVGVNISYEDVNRSNGPLKFADQFPEEASKVLYQDRNTDSLSPRALLASALESTIDASTPEGQIQLKKLTEYKEMVGTLDELNARLNELRSGLFTKGTDGAKRRQMQDEAAKIAARISIYDKKLLTLEASKPLKRVLEREKAQAVKRQKKRDADALRAYRERAEERLRKQAEHYRESRKAAVERHGKSELRQKIKRTVMELDRLLNRGTRENNVKVDMQDTVGSALRLAGVIFNDEISNEDIVRMGSNMATDEELALLDTYRAILEYRDNHPYDENAEKHKRKIQELNKKLSDLFIRERANLNRAKVSSAVNELAEAYAMLKDSKDGYVSLAYNEYAYTRLTSLSKELGGVIAKDMTQPQLQAVYDAFRMIRHMISESNKLFRNGKKEDLTRRVAAVHSQILEHYKKDKSDPRAVINKVREFITKYGWNELKPLEAFETIGSEALVELFWDAIRGEGQWAKEVESAKLFLDEQRENCGYKSWDMESAHTFVLSNGQEFKLTLQDMMSIYAYSKRAQAEEHMTEGGFQFDEYSEYKDGRAKRVHLTGEVYATDWATINAIIAELGKMHDGKVKSYVDAVQEYLTRMGEKGNEVSRVLYGIDIFTEQNYFPLMSASDFLVSVQETLSKTPTTASLKNMGMTKETVPHASNPIILQGFDMVVESHIDKMAKYQSMVLPIENLRRVFDFQIRDESTGLDRSDREGYISTKNIISKTFGRNATDYIEKYITDLNGGTLSGDNLSPTMKLFSKFKGTAVGASLSVIVQQPMAITRAMAVLDPKHFILGKIGKAEGMKLYEEIKKYAPVAIIKEMGGFDTGSGRTAIEYLHTRTDKGISRAAYEVNEKAMLGAQKADEFGWGIIWKAVKREVMSQGKYKYGTQEFFDACGERFTEVIVRTQVYDSVNSRSGFMRSKSDIDRFATSFMGEPTTIVNMAYVSMLKVTRAKTKAEKASAIRGLARTTGVLVASTVLTSLAKSIIYAMRKKDEDDGSFLDRWASQFGGSLLSDMNPLSILPYLRDIVSIFEGWDVERPDMTLFANIFTSAKRMIKDGATLDEVITFIGDIANFFGIPLKNVVRDVKAIYNILMDFINGNIV